MGDYYYNYLQHWGVKGMKWGVRRYQNQDGSLTNAGKKRYLGNSGKTENGNKTENSDKTLNTAKTIINESAKAANTLKQINNRTLKKTHKEALDLSNMTDQQLRSEINRALLEKQYNDMFAPQTQSKGRKYASQILDVGADVLAVTGSALGIALAVKQLKQK